MAAKTSLADMTGRVCVVTGATRGIGRATAERLAELGATLVLVCRRLEDGESVAREIAAAHGGRPAAGRPRRSRPRSAPFATRPSVIRAAHPRVHVLVNNAGLIPKQRETTVDGLEMQFAVNHLAYFLLTNLLLDRLIDGAPSRVVNVSSGAHQGGRLDFGDLQSERRYDPVRVYGRTKLANVLFTYELARRLGAHRRDGQLPPSRRGGHEADGRLHERAAGRAARSPGRSAAARRRERRRASTSRRRGTSKG